MRPSRVPVRDALDARAASMAASCDPAVDAVAEMRIQTSGVCMFVICFGRQESRGGAEVERGT